MFARAQPTRKVPSIAKMFLFETAASTSLPMAASLSSSQSARMFSSAAQALGFGKASPGCRMSFRGRGAADPSSRGCARQPRSSTASRASEKSALRRMSFGPGPIAAASTPALCSSATSASSSRLAAAVATCPPPKRPLPPRRQSRRSTRIDTPARVSPSCAGWCTSCVSRKARLPLGRLRSQSAPQPSKRLASCAASSAAGAVGWRATTAGSSIGHAMDWPYADQPIGGSCTPTTEPRDICEPSCAASTSTSAERCGKGLAAQRTREVLSTTVQPALSSCAPTRHRAPAETRAGAAPLPASRGRYHPTPRDCATVAASRVVATSSSWPGETAPFAAVRRSVRTDEAGWPSTDERSSRE
mmetsp:Transcript_52779/g.170105  ORF Transcript_52779/g.170105 Transcript_52779/m.170105 type:complete len:359 (-) Transcript_52779:361-1437(-)